VYILRMEQTMIVVDLLFCDAAFRFEGMDFSQQH
jgi:hypothetical protein